MANLPPVIPRTVGIGGTPRLPSSSIGRAQQVNISKLNQLKEREAATTSIAGAIKRKMGEEQRGPTTSINRTGGSAPASSSIAHAGLIAGDSYDQNSEAIRDRLRFQHIRQMMREKKEAEKKNEE